MTWFDRLLHRGRRPEPWLIEEPGRASTSGLRIESRYDRDQAKAPEQEAGWPGKGGDR